MGIPTHRRNRRFYPMVSSPIRFLSPAKGSLKAISKHIGAGVHKVCLKSIVLLHSPDDIPDDTILIIALKRGLIDPEAIMPKPDERKVAAGGGKVIPISVLRTAKKSPLRLRDASTSLLPVTENHQ